MTTLFDELDRVERRARRFPMVFHPLLLRGSFQGVAALDPAVAALHHEFGLLTLGLSACSLLGGRLRVVQRRCSLRPRSSGRPTARPGEALRRCAVSAWAC